jgi:hypothetical protein
LLPPPPPLQLLKRLAPLLALLPLQWSTYPPTAFVGMQNDAATRDRIQDQLDVLVAAGTPAAAISVPQRPIYWPCFFSDQAADIPVDLSGRTVSALQEVGGRVGQGARQAGRVGRAGGKPPLLADLS